ncbi:MAG: hypothetical protein JXR45_09150, partial [Deltaproteobacteria bacterium]|nr:hypothetical protein [Deltaproteobacteria bacterium]
NKLQHLPSKRRTTLVLHVVHGYTVKEISDMLSVSPNTTKDRLKTGLKELRQIFDQSPALRQAMLEEIR